MPPTVGTAGTAYRNQDVEHLRELLQREAVEPITPEDRTALPEEIQEAYALFESAWNPLEIGTFLDDPRPFSPFEDDAFLFIPESISVSVGNTFELHPFGAHLREYQYGSTHKGFRPDLSHLGKTIIRFSQTHVDDVWDFLAFQESRESESRRAFLNQVITVVWGHWWGWHVSTFPEIHSIRFNADFTQATLGFRYSFWEHGQAFFDKVDGAWVKRFARITAVE